jgi:hypothetical protein
MKKIGLSVSIILVLSSFYQSTMLTGTWEYAGDIFNGKKEGAPTEYTLQRKYDSSHFEAWVLEKGYDADKYETGDYTLKGDSCLEIQTWCSQPTKLLNITVHYHYSISNDTLTLKGVLPNGSLVEEYWKRVK